MEHKYVKNFDRIWQWVDKLGEFAAFGYAGDDMAEDVKIYPLHLGRTYGCISHVAGRTCRALGSAGRFGYLIITEHGDRIASANYKNTRLWKEEDFLELYRGSLLSGLPVISMIELLDYAASDDEATAVDLYHALAPDIESGIEALMEWDGGST